MTPHSAPSYTCKRCLEGRCIRCENKGTCPCSICGTAAARPRLQRVKTERPSRAGLAESWERSSRAPKNPHRIKGKHGLAGFSTLSEGDQRRVAELLGEDRSISEISRVVGCTRDQVRTIRNRAEGVTHRERKSA